jgi:hypothetical protein
MDPLWTQYVRRYIKYGLEYKQGWNSFRKVQEQTDNFNVHPQTQDPGYYLDANMDIGLEIRIDILICKVIPAHISIIPFIGTKLEKNTRTEEYCSTAPEYQMFGGYKVRYNISHHSMVISRVYYAY